jgi:hypothetical protein
MHMHTNHAKHSLNLDKMLGEKKVELDKNKRDLALWEAVLTEPQVWGLNPRENQEELTGFVELRRCLDRVKVAHIAEARQLAVMVGDISKVLADLGMPPFPRIPKDSGMDNDVQEAVGTVLEPLREAYASGADPWDWATSTPALSCPPGTLFFFFFVFLYVYIWNPGFPISLCSLDHSTNP